MSDKEIENFNVKKGDIFFTRTSETINEIGYPSVMFGNPIDTTFSGFVLRGRADNEDPLTNYFKTYVFFTKQFRNEMMKKSSMTTRALTSGTALKKMIFFNPVQKSEQNKIGILLKNIDNLIVLYQRKIELLEMQKYTLFKSYIFPKQDCSIPEIQFRKFDANQKCNWTELKLGTLGSNVSGVGFPESEQGGIKGIPFFKISDMNNSMNQYQMNVSNNYVTDEQIIRKKWKVINKFPAVIFAKVGAAIMLNRKRIVNSKFLIDNNTMAFVPNSRLTHSFLSPLFSEIYLPKYAQTGALPSYNATDINNIPVKIPGIEEQKCIGKLYQIVVTQQIFEKKQLANTKKLKKFLLDNIFI